MDNPARKKVPFLPPLLPVAVCLIVGIAGQDSAWLPVSPLPVFVVLLVMALLAGRWPRMQSIIILCCVTLLGMVLMEWAQQKASYAFDEQTHELAAVIVSPPQEKPKTMGMDIILPDNGRKLKCYVQKDGQSRLLQLGDGLLLRGQIHPNSQWKKDRFDYARYLTVHGFSGRIYVRDGDWINHQQATRRLSSIWKVKLQFLKWRQHLLSRYTEQATDSDAYAVLAAMTLGDKSALTKELKDTYSATGASHVLALSGLHLSIVYGLLTLLLAGRWRKAGQLLTLVAVWAFVLLTGMSVSVLRAAVMLTTMSILSLRGRKGMSLGSLSLAAIILLCANPYVLFDVGFQLSFLAVLAILLLIPLADSMVSAQWLQRHRLMKWLWGLLMVSVAAQIGTAPLVAYHFGRLPVYFLLTNLVAIPSVMLILGLSVVAWFLPFAAKLMFAVSALLNQLLSHISALPHASWEGLNPSQLLVVMTYVVIFLIYLNLWAAIRDRR